MKRLVIALILSLSLFASSLAQAASVSLVPSSGSVGVGQTFSVDVLVSGLASGQDLGGFELDLLFDPALLNVSGYTLGSSLGLYSPDFMLTEVDDLSSGLTGSGVYSLAAVSLLQDLSVQADSFVLLTLQLLAQDAGASILGLSGTLYDGFGLTLTADLGSASVSASAVPLPGAVWLLLGGLGGCMGLVRRRA